MCDCIDKVQQKLAEHFPEAKIDVGFQLGENSLSVKPSGLGFEFQEFKKDGTPKPKKTHRSLVPTFCPFCGVKYEATTNA